MQYGQICPSLLIKRSSGSRHLDAKRVDQCKQAGAWKHVVKDLQLAKLIVLYPGPHICSLAKNIQVVPLKSMLKSPHDFLGS